MWVIIRWSIEDWVDGTNISETVADTIRLSGEGEDALVFGNNVAKAKGGNQLVLVELRQRLACRKANK